MGRKNNKRFNVVGITPEGIKVVSGVFRVFDTIGFPLDVIFDLCKTKRLLPSWTHFYDDAIKQGWKKDTIFNRLETNISDVYGTEFSTVVLDRLKKYADVA